MWMLIWKNISRRRNQSALTVAITLLTVAVFVMVLGVILTMDAGLTLSRERLGADAVLVPKYSNVDGGDLLFTAAPVNVYMDADVLEQAKRLKGIDAMTPQFFTQTLAMSCCDANEEGRVIGYDPETDFILKAFMPEEFRKGLTERQMIMGADKGNGLLGYSYMVLSRRFDVVALLEPTGTGMDGTMFMTMQEVQDLCLSNPILAMDWRERDPHDCISAIMIKLQEGIDPKEFQAYAESSGIDAQCLLTSETIAEMQDQLDVIRNIMIALWLASLMIAVLTLIGRFSALARERKKEIGLLRAIGMTKGKVFALIIGETCTMALMGGILGSSIALWAVRPVLELLQDAFRMSASVWDASLAGLCGIAGIFLAVLMGFAASVSPALKSAGMDPQAAITQGEV